MKKCFTINAQRDLDYFTDCTKNLLMSGVYHGIEIFYPYNVEKKQYEFYTESIRKIKDNFNTEIVMHLPHGPKNDLCNFAVYKDVIKIMQDAIDYSSQFAIKKLTLHLGYADKDTDREKYIKHIVEVLKKLCLYASQYGMNVMIENMPGYVEVGYSPSEIKTIIEQTGAENLKFILDTGHAHVSEYSIEEYINTLEKYLYHLHLNDNSGRRDEHGRIGSGTIDFKAFVTALSKINYSELYCMEILHNNYLDLLTFANDLDECVK